MNEVRALAAFSALANVTRLRILRCLVAAGNGGLNAGEIAEAVAATPSRASFHLSSMSDTGLITSIRQARQIIYCVDFEIIGELMLFLMQDCCKNNEIVRACCLADNGS